MSDYSRSRWKEIQSMGPRARWAPGYDRVPDLRRRRPSTNAAIRRGHGVTLHPKHIDREAGGTGYYSAPAGYRWEKGELVRRHAHRYTGARA